MDVGVSFYEQRNYPAAIAEFQEAYKSTPKASPLVNMALCYKALFAYTKAIRALETAKEKHADTMDENDKKAAQTEIEEMRLRLSYVTFKMSPADAAVQIDGEDHPEAAQGKAVQLDPGPHAIKVYSEGFAPVEQTFTLASGKHELPFALRPNMGFVKIKADGPKFAIAVDQKPLAYGEWAGFLPPGPHIVEFYLPSSPVAPYRMRVDIEAGKSYDLARGKGGVPILGSGGSNTTPPPQQPPKAPEKPVTGFFALATVSLFIPLQHPPPFDKLDPSTGVTGGLRAGYRVNTPVSFDLMLEYSNMHQRKSDPKTNYTLEQARAGLNMRLQTPHKTARFYGGLGGGFVYEALNFNFDGVEQCKLESCKAVDGVDGYFLIEAGLQFSLGKILLDLALGTFLQSTRSFRALTYPDILPIFEAGLRVGYATW